MLLRRRHTTQPTEYRWSMREYHYSIRKSISKQDSGKSNGNCIYGGKHGNDKVKLFCFHSSTPGQLSKCRHLRKKNREKLFKCFGFISTNYDTNKKVIKSLRWKRKLKFPTLKLENFPSHPPTR